MIHCGSCKDIILHSFLPQHILIEIAQLMKEATGFTITYGVILFYPNFFFFAVTVLLNVVLLQLKQASSPLGQLTIAESSDVSREYYPNY